MPDSKPEEILRQAMQDATVTPHVIRLCLDTQYERAAALPRKYRRDFAQEQGRAGLAALALKCMWSDERLWRLIVVFDRNTLFRLSYYAILEGLEDLVIDFAFVTPTDTSVLAEEGPYSVWRGQLLESLVQAHSFYATFTTGLSGMLRCMLHIVNKQAVAITDYKTLSSGSNAPRFDPSIVSLQPAAKHCASALRDNLDGNTDVELFEKFAKWWATTHRSFSRHVDMASLAMCHPRTPTETLAIDFLQAHPKQVHYSQYKEHRTNAYFNQFLQRTFDLAVRNNNAEGAAWIKGHFQDRLDPATDRFAPPTARDIARSRLKKRQAQIRAEKQIRQGGDRPRITDHPTE